MIKDILYNLNFFVDGRGQAGKIEEITLPKLTLEMMEYRAGGMSSTVDIPMGAHEKMEVEFTLKSFDADVLNLFNVTLNANVPLTARGAMQDQDGTKHSVVVEMRGVITEMDMGTWKLGDDAMLKVKASLHYYHLTYDNNSVIECDPSNLVFKVGGTDQLADTRQMLGM